MTTTQVGETSVSVNSPIQHCVHPDNHTQPKVLFVEFLEKLFKVLESHNCVFRMAKKRVDFWGFFYLVAVTAPSYKFWFNLVGLPFRFQCDNIA